MATTKKQVQAVTKKGTARAAAKPKVKVTAKAETAAKAKTAKTAKTAPKKTSAPLAAKKSAVAQVSAKPEGKRAAPARTKSAPKKVPSSVAVGALDVGSKAPGFSLLDQRGNVVNSASLKGTPYVLYFYPRDNTPGCTQEACDFRDAYRAFEGASVRVFGVSPDSQKSHEGFVAKHGLSFTLLSDSDTALAQAYGAWALKKNYGREFWGIVRSTFLIGADGKIRRIWRNVRVDGHAQAVLAEAGTL